MVNQYCVLLVRCLNYVEVDIAGVKTYVDFEVIDIMGDKDPYPALLGIDLDFKNFENYAVIDLKKETMTFKVGQRQGDSNLRSLPMSQIYCTSGLYESYSGWVH